MDSKRRRRARKRTIGRAKDTPTDQTVNGAVSNTDLATVGEHEIDNGYFATTEGSGIDESPLPTLSAEVIDLEEIEEPSYQSQVPKDKSQKKKTKAAKSRKFRQRKTDPSASDGASLGVNKKKVVLRGGTDSESSGDEKDMYDKLLTTDPFVPSAHPNGKIGSKFRTSERFDHSSRNLTIEQAMGYKRPQKVRPEDRFFDSQDFTSLSRMSLETQKTSRPSCLSIKGYNFMFDEEKIAMKKQMKTVKGYVKRKKRNIAFDSTVSIRVYKYNPIRHALRNPALKRFNKEGYFDIFLGLESRVREQLIKLKVIKDPTTKKLVSGDYAEANFDSPEDGMMIMNDDDAEEIENEDEYIQLCRKSDIKWKSREIKPVEIYANDGMENLRQVTAMTTKLQHSYQGWYAVCSGRKNIHEVTVKGLTMLQNLLDSLPGKAKQRFRGIFGERDYRNLFIQTLKMNLIVMALEKSEVVHRFKRICGHSIFNTMEMHRHHDTVSELIDKCFDVFCGGEKIVDDVELDPRTGDFKSLLNIPSLTYDDRQMLAGRILVHVRDVSNTKARHRCVFTKGIVEETGNQAEGSTFKIKKNIDEKPKFVEITDFVPYVVDDEYYKHLDVFFTNPIKAWLDVKVRFFHTYMKMINLSQYIATLTNNMWLLRKVESKYISPALKNTSYVYYKYRNVFELSYHEVARRSSLHHLKVKEKKRKKDVFKKSRDSVVTPLSMSELKGLPKEKRSAMLAAVKMRKVPVDYMSWVVSTGVRLDLYASYLGRACSMDCRRNRGKLLCRLVQMGNNDMVDWLIDEGVSVDLVTCCGEAVEAGWSLTPQNHNAFAARWREELAQPKKEGPVIDPAGYDVEGAKGNHAYFFMEYAYSTRKKFLTARHYTDDESDKEFYLNLKDAHAQVHAPITPVALAISCAMQGGSVETAQWLLSKSKKSVRCLNLLNLRSCLPFIEKMAKYKKKQEKRESKLLQNKGDEAISSSPRGSKAKKNMLMSLIKKDDNIEFLNQTKTSGGKEFALFKRLLNLVGREMKAAKLKGLEMPITCKMALLYEAFMYQKWDVIRFLAPCQDLTNRNGSFSSSSGPDSRKGSGKPSVDTLNKLKMGFDPVVAVALSKAISWILRETLKIGIDRNEVPENERYSCTLPVTSTARAFDVVYFVCKEYGIFLENEQWEWVVKILLNQLEHVPLMRGGERAAIERLFQLPQFMHYMRYHINDGLEELKLSNFFLKKQPKKVVLTMSNFDDIVIRSRPYANSQQKNRVFVGLGQCGFYSLVGLLSLTNVGTLENFRMILHRSVIKRPHFSMFRQITEVLQLRFKREYPREISLLLNESLKVKANLSLDQDAFRVAFDLLSLGIAQPDQETLYNLAIIALQYEGKGFYTVELIEFPEKNLVFSFARMKLLHLLFNRFGKDEFGSVNVDEKASYLYKIVVHFSTDKQVGLEKEIEYAMLLQELHGLEDEIKDLDAYTLDVWNAFMKNVTDSVHHIAENYEFDFSGPNGNVIFREVQREPEDGYDVTQIDFGKGLQTVVVSDML